MGGTWSPSNPIGPFPVLLKLSLQVFSYFFISCCWKTYARGCRHLVSHQKSVCNILCTIVIGRAPPGWARLLSYPRKDERLVEEIDVWNRGESLFKYWVSFSQWLLIVELKSLTLFYFCHFIFFLIEGYFFTEFCGFLSYIKHQP